MRIYQCGVLALAFLFWPSLVLAQDVKTAYSSQIFLEDAAAVKLETAAIFSVITALGLKSWNWGSSNSFKISSEGWFGRGAGSGGADKIGHAFTNYAITNLLTERLIAQGREPAQAALTSVLITQALWLYVEVFDGYSKDHGFAPEDVVMNLLGSGLAYARHVNPDLKGLVDFRMEYWPSGYKGFRPLTDYSGQKFLLALKLSGFDALRNTPLRYLELQTGYYTRGFSKAEREDDLERTRHSFVGVGLNLSELLFGQRRSGDSGLRHAGQVFFEHIQIPHTAVRSERRF